MSESVRVLHVIAGGRHGGAETYALDAIEGLAAAGVAQHVVCRPHPRYLAAFERLGVSHDRLGFSPWERLLGRGRLIRDRARSFGATVVHAWMGRAASFIPAGVEIPVIGWFGGYYTLERYRRCSFYIGVTRDIGRHIAAASGRPQRTFVVHTFGTLPEDPPLSRSTFETPEDRPLALCLARLHPKKGIDTLLRAVVRLPSFILWIAGEGPEGDRYRALAGELGVADRVRFLGWRNDRKALLEAADLCVLPSRYEPFGTVIVEAWASRRPLVATRAAGAAQYVRDGQDGLLVDIDDDQGLAHQMARVIAEPGLRDSLVEQGWQSYQQGFTREAAIAQLIAAYRSVVRIGSGLPPVAVAALPVATLAGRMAGLPALAGWNADTRWRAAAAALAHLAGPQPGMQELAANAAVIEASGRYSFLRGAGSGLSQWMRRPVPDDRGQERFVQPWCCEEFAIAFNLPEIACILDNGITARSELDGLLREFPFS